MAIKGILMGEGYLRSEQIRLPSFTKPFGTHTFYQGGSAGPPCYLKNCCPHEREIL